MPAVRLKGHDARFRKISAYEIIFIRLRHCRGSVYAARISATDWLEETRPDEPSWRSEDTVRLSALLAAHGVDLLDISTSGNSPHQRIKTGPGYQVPFAEAVKRAHGDKILVAAVGQIYDGPLAQSILDQGRADVILNGRMFQKNPGLVWTFADELGVELCMARQIQWPFSGRAPSRR